MKSFDDKYEEWMDSLAEEAEKEGKAEKVTCELCGEEYKGDDNYEDIEFIKEYGRCTGCYEEWGDQYPDRV